MSISISVFIVNYNTCDLLERCLKSIFESRGHLTVEIFIADNNSTDGSVDMVEKKFPEVRLVRYSENKGYTKAINPLLPLGQGEYYLLLHPDLQLLPNTLHRFLEVFKVHPEAGILGGNLYYPDGTPNPCEILFPDFRGELLCFSMRLFKKAPGGNNLLGIHNPLEWSHKSTSQVNWVWNACMVVRREVFEAIGYFDESFFVWFADWDLCKRASDAGWSIYYVHSAVAIHYESQSFLEEPVTREEVIYKVDGWYSAAEQMCDRQMFLKKHCGQGSIHGIKIIYIVQNTLRVWLILGRLMIRRTKFKDASFQLKACLQTIQAILRA